MLNTQLCQTLTIQDAQFFGRRFFLAQPNPRRLAVAPYPHEAQTPFCL